MSYRENGRRWVKCGGTIMTCPIHALSVPHIYIHTCTIHYTTCIYIIILYCTNLPLYSQPTLTISCVCSVFAQRYSVYHLGTQLVSCGAWCKQDFSKCGGLRERGGWGGGRGGRRGRECINHRLHAQVWRFEGGKGRERVYISVTDSMLLWVACCLYSSA